MEAEFRDELALFLPGSPRADRTAQHLALPDTPRPQHTRSTEGRKQERVHSPVDLQPHDRSKRYNKESVVGMR